MIKTILAVIGVIALVLLCAEICAGIFLRRRRNRMQSKGWWEE